MIQTELIRALRSIGKPVCLQAADRLDASTGSVAKFDLHLRHAGLNTTNARVLADGLSRAGAGLLLRSFSVSYNPDLGDIGATALAEVFPETMTELGLVGCSIGDAGGRSVLQWAETARDIRMICIEGNNLSVSMKSQFKDFAALNCDILVVV